MNTFDTPQLNVYTFMHQWGMVFPNLCRNVSVDSEDCENDTHGLAYSGQH
jgi:hypothetical protein